MVRAESPEREFVLPLSLVEVVVLVGGSGGTFMVYQHAMTAKKRVYPLAGTGGDGKRAFEDLAFSTSGAGWLHRLDMPLASPDAARALARTLVEMLLPEGDLRQPSQDPKP